MVDIICVTDTVSNTVEVVDCCKDIVNRDVVRNKLICTASEHFLEVILILAGIKNFAKNIKTNILLDITLCFCVKINIAGDVNHTV